MFVSTILKFVIYRIISPIAFSIIAVFVLKYIFSLANLELLSDTNSIVITCCIFVCVSNWYLQYKDRHKNKI